VTKVASGMFDSKAAWLRGSVPILRNPIRRNQIRRNPNPNP